MGKLVRIAIETTASDAKAEHVAARSDSNYVIENVEALARDPETPLQEARFVDPVTMTVTATLAVLAVRMVNHWLKSEERGVQIDLRTDPATISKLAGVPAGVIVVIDRSGTATVHREKYETPEDFLPSLTGFLSGAADGIS